MKFWKISAAGALLLAGCRLPGDAARTATIYNSCDVTIKVQLVSGHAVLDSVLLAPGTSGMVGGSADTHPREVWSVRVMREKPHDISDVPLPPSMYLDIDGENCPTG